MFPFLSRRDFGRDLTTRRRCLFTMALAPISGSAYFFADPFTATLEGDFTFFFLDGVALSLSLFINVPPVTFEEDFVTFFLSLVWELLGFKGSTFTTSSTNAAVPSSGSGFLRGRPRFRFLGAGAPMALESLVSLVRSSCPSVLSLIFSSNFSIRDPTAHRARLLPSSLYKSFESRGDREYPPSRAACCRKLVMLVAPATLPILFCATPGCFFLSDTSDEPLLLVA
mmetsp:Transcript_40257/g.84549  ORF Transcript_40257/g.84549 Transcript_40257/m.84549 type:complete len:226 (-) Transcript_40257:678-1355(-)